MPLKDITGQRFGKLVVLRRDGTYKSPKGLSATTWLCRCDCGNEIVVVKGSLQNGCTKSCGCQHWVHPFNDYRVEGDVVYIKVKDKEVLIDKEDLSKVFSQRIYIQSKGYPMIGKTLLHRIILDAPKDKVIDHINHNPLDNRKSNLRLVTQSENLKNKRPLSNTGYLGISRTKKGYYMVQLNKKYIGNATTIEEALKIRKEYLETAGEKYAQNNYYLNFAQ